MKDSNPNGKLQRGHLEAVSKAFKGYTPRSDYEGLVRLFADIVDTALDGRDCYASFGLSRDKSLIMLTVTYGGSKLYASGLDLKELSANAELLL